MKEHERNVVGAKFLFRFLQAFDHKLVLPQACTRKVRHEVETNHQRQTISSFATELPRASTSVEQGPIVFGALVPRHPIHDTVGALDVRRRDRAMWSAVVRQNPRSFWVYELRQSGRKEGAHRPAEMFFFAAETKQAPDTCMFPTSDEWFRDGR